ncbi:MAG: MFS transporter [Rhodospirillales bacterium]|nr:MFS transporter [Rhodospirillales bacterium]
MALAGIVTFLNMYSIQAVLPLIAGSFATPPATAGLTITATTAAVALVAPVVGTISDLLGRKRLIVGAIWLLIGPTLMVGLAHSLGAMIAWRFVQGLLLPFVFAVTIAYVADETEGPETIRLAGTYASGTIFAGFFGRFLAGWTADFLGWRAAFFVLACCTLAAAIAVGWLLPKERNFRPVSGWRETRRGFAEHLRNPRLLGTYAVGFTVLFVIVAAFTYANFLLAAPPFRLGPAGLGSIFVVYLAGMVATPLATRLAVRIGRRPTLLGATAVGVAGLALTLAPSLAAIVAGLAVFAAAAFVQGALAIGFIGAAARRAKSTAVGLYVMVYYIGGSLGGVAPAPLWHDFGWPGCVALCVAVQALMLGAALTTWREGGGRESPVTSPE